MHVPYLSATFVTIKPSALHMDAMAPGPYVGMDGSNVAVESLSFTYTPGQMNRAMYNFAT
jgi:hypothetical protein